MSDQRRLALQSGKPACRGRPCRSRRHRYFRQTRCENRPQWPHEYPRRCLELLTTGLMRNSASASRCRARGPEAGAGQGPLHRRHQPARPGLCRDGALAVCARHASTASIPPTAAAMPGVLGVYTGAGPRGLRHAQMHRAAQEPRRHADEEAAAACARRPTRCASSAIRWPSWSPRPRSRPGRRRGRRARHRAAAGGDARRARQRKPGAPLLYDDVPDNVALDYHYGDSDKVAEAFAKAAHVTTLSLRNTRLVVARWSRARRSANTMPTSERYTLHAQARACSA